MDLAFKIEDTTHEAEVLRSMVLAVYDATYNGSANYEELEGAFHAAFCMAHKHMEHLKELQAEVLETRRTGHCRKNETVRRDDMCLDS